MAIFFIPGENRLSTDAPFAQVAAERSRANSDVSPGRLRRSLRAATRVEHKALDAVMGEIDLTSRAAYGVFLNIHFVALCTLQPRCRPMDYSDFTALAECARHDLKALQFGLPQNAISADTAFTPQNDLGAAYVIRGSRLGAAILLSRVPAEFPTSYLSFMPAKSWHEFLNELEAFSQGSAPGVDREVIRGARFAFEIFSKIAATQLSLK
jgi:heme oxygenase (biliverdin-IX-beta and delta-forming)